MTRTVYHCSRCGSDEVVQTANYYPNTGKHGDPFDGMECSSCGYDGHDFTETEEPATSALDPGRLPMRSRMIVLLRQVHTLIAIGQRTILDNDVVPLVQDLTDGAERLAEELELAAAMEAALMRLSESGCFASDDRENPPVAQAKAEARAVLYDIVLKQPTRD